MADDIFDFGFTAVTEDELEMVQSIKAEAEMINESSFEVKERLEKLYSAIQPLLNNLKANPGKDYIYWPNRLVKVEQFSDMLDKIYSGD